MTLVNRVTPRIRVADQATVIQMPETMYSSSDECVLQQARRFLVELAETINPPYLVVDLSRTASFGARFLGVLVLAWRRLNERHGRLALCGLNPRSAELVHLARLERLFDLYSTTEAAVEAISMQARKLVLAAR